MVVYDTVESCCSGRIKLGSCGHLSRAAYCSPTLPLNVSPISSMCLKYLRHLFATARCAVVGQELNCDNCEIVKAISGLVHSMAYICEPIMLW